MTIRLPILLLGLVLAAGLYFGASAWQHAARDGLVGLTEMPCKADGTVATGFAADDWAGRCIYRAANAELMASHALTEVVMIGDSLTMGWPDRKGVVNRGIGKQTSDQVLLRFREDAVQLRPRLVHILVGINDVAGITGPVTIEQYRGNMAAMIEAAQANGIAVILGTIPSASRFPDNAKIDPGPPVAQVNAALRSLAAEKGVVLADYNAAVSQPDGTIRPALYLADGVHPNAGGYAAMQPVLDAALVKARAQSALGPEQISGSK